MQRVPSGTTTRAVYFPELRQTGLSSFTVYQSRNGAAWASKTTHGVSEGDATNAPGAYEILVNQDTTIGAGNLQESMAFYITAAGMEPVYLVIQIVDVTLTAAVLAVDAAQKIWDSAIVEDAPATDITARGAMSLLLAEALGPGAFTAGSPDTWVVKDPSNAVTRLTITYGTDNGDRNTPTIVPDAP